jgi:hypothetical protein
LKNVKIIVSVAFVLIAVTILSIRCGKDKSIKPTPTTAKWTILVYAAGNTYMDTTLDGQSLCIGDIQALENVGSSNDVKVIAMLSSLKTSGIAKYYQIGHFQDSANVISSPVLENLGARNMADGTTLKDFLLYGIRNYPAENYMLLVDGYGAGWPGCCRDDHNGGGNLMHTTDMANAIEQALSESGVPKLEVMAFYAPLMGMTEVAYELRNYAKWLVASEIKNPMQNLLSPEGWLAPLISDPDAYSNTLATNFAQSIYNEGQNRSAIVQIAVIDLSQITRVANLANGLGDNLSSYPGPFWNEILAARNQSHHSKIDDAAYVDLLEFAINLNNAPNLHNLDYISAYFDSLNNSINSAVPINLKIPEFATRGGLTIHLPASRDLYDSTNYARLDFHYFDWNNFVSNFISMAEGNGLSTTISGIVTCSEHSLTNYTFAFLDTIHSPYALTFDSTSVNPANGAFSFTIGLSDSIAFAFEAWDDIDQDGHQNSGDSWGFWDSDGDNQWEPAAGDMIWVHPGQNIIDINIQMLIQSKNK